MASAREKSHSNCHADLGINDSKTRLEILLLVSTLLFGVTTQVLLKDYALGQALKGLLFESLVLLLFGSYIYLLLGLGNSNELDKVKEYEQISITQILVLNGVMISILISYSISLMGLKSITGQFEDNTLYPLTLIGVFVILPVWAYFRDISVLSTFGGIYPAEELLGIPIIPAVTIVTFFSIVILNIILLSLSKLFNVIVMASLLIYLPYLWIESEEELHTLSRTHKQGFERVIGYLILVYRVYIIGLILGLFYDGHTVYVLLKSSLKTLDMSPIVDILLILSFVFMVLFLMVKVLKKSMLEDTKNTKMLFGLSLLATLFSEYLVLFSNIKSLTMGIFLFYGISSSVMYLTYGIESSILPKLLSKLKRGSKANKEEKGN